MQIQTFQVFCDLVETSSFSQAAEKNGVTQSAVSQQIRAIEGLYGVTLIERGKKHFAVTPEGEVFLKAARKILDSYRDIDYRLKEMRDQVAGPLHIATVYSIGFHELPPYLKLYRKQFPDVDLKVHYRRANQVYADVFDSRVDLGLVAYPQARKGIEVEPVWQDKLVLICPPKHELAKKEMVDLKELEGQRFISFEPDLPTRKAIDGILKKAGVKIKEVVEFDNIETVKRGVEIENAVSIVPSLSVQEEVEAGILAAAEIDSPDVWRPLGIIRRRTKAISPPMREMIALLKSDIESPLQMA